MRRAAGHQVAPRSFHPDNPDSGHREGTASQPHPAPATRRVLRQPDSGTMDTSRGHDGPIDSRADRQLRAIEGCHIMTWRQLWRQRWRPMRMPSPSHRHDSDREGRRESPAGGGWRGLSPLATASCLTVSGVPLWVGALRPVIRPGHRLLGRHEGPGFSDWTPVGSCAPVKRWRPPAWRLGASGGRHPQAPGTE
jgi:hypothetical protein